LENYNYPKDRLYLRVGNLLTSLKDVANKNGNLSLYAYLLTISRSIKPEDIEVVIKTEKFILSKNFLNQRDFVKDKDKESMIPIIRDYKLNSINI
jgi:hypothetical protein